jgi:hypothetical protein
MIFPTDTTLVHAAINGLNPMRSGSGATNGNCLLQTRLGRMIRGIRRKIAGY